MSRTVFCQAGFAFHSFRKVGIATREEAAPPARSTDLSVATGKRLGQISLDDLLNNPSMTIWFSPGFARQHRLNPPLRPPRRSKDR